MESPKRHIDIARPKGLDAALATRETNLYRRNLLKLAAVGGGAFIAGKLSGPIMDLVVGDKVLSMRDFKDFRFIETRNEFKLLDKDGGEVLIVDKDVVGK